MTGSIRQELLSGIPDKKTFKKLQRKLRAFDDAELTTEHYEMAALYANECRRHGIQGSHRDFLLCAVSIKNNCPIFTLDKDFDRYKEHIKINLHVVRKEV